MVLNDWTQIAQQIASRWFITVIDVLIVAFLIYRLLLLARGTRAWQLMLGLLVFSLTLYLTNVLGLETIHWLLDRMTTLGPVALVLLFFPELRRVLETMGRVDFWRFRTAGDKEPIVAAIQEVVEAVGQMSRERIGALIIWERNDRVGEGKGVELNAEVAAPLLRAIFYPGSPLHDGAVILRETEITEAAVYLAELSQNEDIPAHLHTRHRAGIGAAEHSDCIAIIVSEERGRITVAMDGSWTMDIDTESLQRLLEDLLVEPRSQRIWQRVESAFQQARKPRKEKTKRIEEPEPEKVKSGGQ